MEAKRERIEGSKERKRAEIDQANKQTNNKTHQSYTQAETNKQGHDHDLSKSRMLLLCQAGIADVEMAFSVIWSFRKCSSMLTPI
eukprot:m.123433 g.123433  ORF g.123433 m.123433 type:complete len:85 (-) comp15573_c0_seq2:350-604(-)